MKLPSLTIRHLLTYWTLIALLALAAIAATGLYSNHLLVNNIKTQTQISKLISKFGDHIDSMVTATLEAGLATDIGELSPDSIEEKEEIMTAYNNQLNKELDDIKTSMKLEDVPELMGSVNYLKSYFSKLRESYANVVNQKREFFSIKKKSDALLSTIRKVTTKGVDTLESITGVLSLYEKRKIRKIRKKINSRSNGSQAQDRAAMLNDLLYTGNITDIAQSLQIDIRTMLLLSNKIASAKSADLLQDIEKNNINQIVDKMATNVSQLHIMLANIKELDSRRLNEEITKFTTHFEQLSFLLTKSDDSLLSLHRQLLLSQNQLNTTLEDSKKVSEDAQAFLRNLISEEIRYMQGQSQYIIKASYATVITSAVVIFFLLLLISMKINNRISKQLQKALHFMEKIAGGDLKTNIEISDNNDEIDQILMALDKMKLQLSDHIEQLQNQHQKKMEDLANMVSGVAHEIRNPMNFVTNFSESLLDCVQEMEQSIDQASSENKNLEPEYLKSIITDLSNCSQKIMEHIKRTDGIITSMVMHTQPSSGKVDVDINKLINDTIQVAMKKEVQDHNMEVTLIEEYDDNAEKISIIPSEVIKVIRNIFSNAYYYASKSTKNKDPEFTPTIKIKTHQLSKCIEIRIHDNGDGIEESLHSKIFNPFFTTKPTGEGIGLGLSLSYDVISILHRGDLSFQTQPGEYTEFIISIPND